MVRATGLTAVISAIVLVVAVVVPFFAPTKSAHAAELTYLGWSLRALAGVTLATSLVYYVRALAQRARLIAETEVRSRQFALDVDRAQWLVEMALEYDKSSKPLSPELVSAFSRGLFEPEHTSGSDGPMGLKELLLNADGLEVSLSKRGVRRALRSVAVPTEVPPPS